MVCAFPPGALTLESFWYPLLAPADQASNIKGVYVPVALGGSQDVTSVEA